MMNNGNKTHKNHERRAEVDRSTNRQCLFSCVAAVLS